MSVEVDGITAVLVTRGNVDMLPIINSLPFKEIIVWDNSEQTVDMSVYGRYAGIIHATNDVIYVQDDDCIVPCIDLLIENYVDGEIIANMPADHIIAGNYHEHCLVGWGALFRKDLPVRAFGKYLSHYRVDEAFNDGCDVVFTTLTPFKTVDGGHENFDYAYGTDRMYHRQLHNNERAFIHHRSRIVAGREKRNADA